MIRFMLTAATSIAILAGVAAPLAAAPCRDAKGRFMKCAPPSAPVRCRDSKGHFAKCGTQGAVPAKK